MAKKRFIQFLILFLSLGVILYFCLIVPSIRSTQQRLPFPWPYYAFVVPIAAFLLLPLLISTFRHSVIEKAKAIGIISGILIVIFIIYFIAIVYGLLFNPEILTYRTLIR